MVFIDVQRQALCISLLSLEINCFLCSLQFKGTNFVLTRVCLAACLTKIYFFGYPQVCLPSFCKFCSWIHWADAMLDYVYASHLFGRANQNLYDSLGLGSLWGGMDASGGNFCCSEWELISWWCLLAQCLLQWWFKNLDHEQVPEHLWFLAPLFILPLLSYVSQVFASPWGLGRAVWKGTQSFLWAQTPCPAEQNRTRAQRVKAALTATSWCCWTAPYWIGAP